MKGKNRQEDPDGFRGHVTNPTESCVDHEVGKQGGDNHRPVSQDSGSVA